MSCVSDFAFSVATGVFTSYELYRAKNNFEKARSLLIPVAVCVMQKIGSKVFPSKIAFLMQRNREGAPRF